MSSRSNSDSDSATPRLSGAGTGAGAGDVDPYRADPGSFSSVSDEMARGMTPRTTSRKVPSMFEIQVTKDAIQRRIDAGEITTEDIETLRRPYRWMAISAMVGASTGAPAYWYLRRRRVPPVGMLPALAAAAVISGTGWFMGFTAAGVAGAMDVQRNMPDATNKLEVFKEIFEESKLKIEEARRSGVDVGDTGNEVSWGPRAGTVPVPPPTPQAPPAPSSSGSGPGSGAAAGGARAPLPPSRGPISDEVNSSTGTTWDAVRATRPYRRGDAALSPEDELKRQQAEFDAMLERERRGGSDSLNAQDKWQ